MITVHHGGNAHLVPCGKCAFCLTNKRSQWMFRLAHEMRLQEHPGYFLTLTYDEKHVKRVHDCGLSLRFRDVQLFLKRLRKEKYYAKYVCVGEYGFETQRPHYHMLLWTSAPPGRIEALWRQGQIHFGQLTMASAMYTLKYIIQPKQKQVGRLEPTRAQFSKGLGLGYLTTGVYDYHTFDYDEPVMFSVVDGRKVALPRYYKQKIFTRHQLRIQCSKTKSEKLKADTKNYRALRAQGIKKIRPYLKALRIEQAVRIISKTKYNQVL